MSIVIQSISAAIGKRVIPHGETIYRTCRKRCQPVTTDDLCGILAGGTIDVTTKFTLISLV